MLRGVGLNSRTHLSKNKALRMRTESGLLSCFSAWRNAVCRLPCKVAAIPSYIRSKVARHPTSSLRNCLATSWNTPNIERSPTAVCLPVKALWPESCSMARWNKSN